MSRGDFGSKWVWGGGSHPGCSLFGLCLLGEPTAPLIAPLPVIRGAVCQELCPCDLLPGLNGQLVELEGEIHWPLSCLVGYPHRVDWPPPTSQALDVRVLQPPVPWAGGRPGGAAAVRDSPLLCPSCSAG